VNNILKSLNLYCIAHKLSAPSIFKSILIFGGMQMESISALDSKFAVNPMSFINLLRAGNQAIQITQQSIFKIICPAVNG
jgi:hypothetical protein